MPKTLEAVGWEYGTLESRPMERATEPRESLRLLRMPRSAMFGMDDLAGFGDFLGGLVMRRLLACVTLVSLGSHVSRRPYSQHICGEGRDLLEEVCHGSILALALALDAFFGGASGLDGRAKQWAGELLLGWADIHLSSLTPETIGPSSVTLGKRAELARMCALRQSDRLLLRRCSFSGLNRIDTSASLEGTYTRGSRRAVQQDGRRQKNCNPRPSRRVKGTGGCTTQCSHSDEDDKRKTAGTCLGLAFDALEARERRLVALLLAAGGHGQLGGRRRRARVRAAGITTTIVPAGDAADMVGPAVGDGLVVVVVVVVDFVLHSGIADQERTGRLDISGLNTGRREGGRRDNAGGTGWTGNWAADTQAAGHEGRRAGRRRRPGSASADSPGRTRPGP